MFSIETITVSVSQGFFFITSLYGKCVTYQYKLNVVFFLYFERLRSPVPCLTQVIKLSAIDRDNASGFVFHAGNRTNLKVWYSELHPKAPCKKFLRCFNHKMWGFAIAFLNF